jgi:hypothetical protein
MTSRLRARFAERGGIGKIGPSRRCRQCSEIGDAWFWTDTDDPEYVELLSIVCDLYWDVADCTRARRKFTDIDDGGPGKK